MNTSSGVPAGRNHCNQIIKLTRRLPDRGRVTPHTLAPRVGFGDLQRLERAGQALLASLKRP